MYFPVRNIEPCCQILVVRELELSSEIDIVAPQTVTFHAISEPRVFDAVKVAKTRSKCFVEVLSLHTVHHIDTGLAVFSGGYENKVLTFRVLGIAHQHHLVTFSRKTGVKLTRLYQHTVPIHGDGGHLHPVGFNGAASEGLAAHKVMCPEGILLLKRDLVVAVHLLHSLDLAAGCRHHYLTTHRPYTVNYQFEDNHRLPDRQCVKCKVCQSVHILPQTVSATKQSVNERPDTTQGVGYNLLVLNAVCCADWLVKVVVELPIVPHIGIVGFFCMRGFIRFIRVPCLYLFGHLLYRGISRFRVLHLAQLR